MKAYASRCLPPGRRRAQTQARPVIWRSDQPQRIDYPTLLDDQDFRLLGYPLESVIAEKADTMMLLGDANTRDRDYGDVYRLSEIHPVEAEPLRRALRSVAEHRHHEIRLLSPLLDTLRDTRQQPWETFRARVGLSGLPERFSEVVDGVVEFVDGVQDEDVSRWHPTDGVGSRHLRW